MKRINKNKWLNNAFTFAIALLCASLLFSIGSGYYATTHKDSTELEQENVEDIPNIDIPEGAHAFKIGDEWTYAYEGDTWEVWLGDSDRWTYTVMEDAEGCLYTVNESAGSSDYICLVEGEGEEAITTPVTLSDTILFNVTYDWVAG